MLSRFLKTQARAAAAQAAIPAGQRVYAIGDIHGRLDLVDALLALIDEDDATRGLAETTLVFLGDLVDRGPASAQVVDRLMMLDHDERHPRRYVRFLMGNHEEIFLSALAGDEKALRLFCRIGGRETVLSYGVQPDDYERLDYAELAACMDTVVSADHRSFLAGFEDLVEIGDYAFVHAGVRPGVELADQRTADLRWIRDPCLDHRARLSKLIVHGHTISDDVEFRPHRIGVDTGAYVTGRLSAVGLEGTASWCIQTPLD